MLEMSVFNKFISEYVLIFSNAGSLHPSKIQRFPNRWINNAPKIFKSKPGKNGILSALHAFSTHITLKLEHFAIETFMRVISI